MVLDFISRRENYFQNFPVFLADILTRPEKTYGSSGGNAGIGKPPPARLTRRGEHEGATPMLEQHATHPAVRMTSGDYRQLSDLSEAAQTLGGTMLTEELERAIVVEPNHGDEPFVRLHSQVQYIDLTSGRTRTLQVVPPAEADIDHRRISVLSPVGAALIGLAAGDSYNWTGEDGRPHVLLVVEVGGERAKA